MNTVRAYWTSRKRYAGSSRDGTLRVHWDVVPLKIDPERARDDTDVFETEAEAEATCKRRNENQFD